MGRPVLRRSLLPHHIGQVVRERFFALGNGFDMRSYTAGSGSVYLTVRTRAWQFTTQPIILRIRISNHAGVPSREPAYVCFTILNRRDTVDQRIDTLASVFGDIPYQEISDAWGAVKCGHSTGEVLEAAAAFIPEALKTFVLPEGVQKIPLRG